MSTAIKRLIDTYLIMNFLSWQLIIVFTGTHQWTIPYAGDIWSRKEHYFELLMAYLSHITRNNVDPLMSTGKRKLLKSTEDGYRNPLEWQWQWFCTKTKRWPIHNCRGSRRSILRVRSEVIITSLTFKSHHLFHVLCNSGWFEVLKLKKKGKWKERKEAEWTLEQ